MIFETFEKAVREGILPTASYVFACEEIEERVRFIRSHLPSGIRIVYAVKANPFIAAVLAPHVDGLELCSPGEEHICEESGIGPEKYVISGVNKEENDISHDISFGETAGKKSVYTIESESQAELLEKLAGERGLALPVLIRLTAGNQFGVDEETLTSMIESRTERFPHLDIRGIQFYSGTQKKDKKIRAELEMLDKLIASLRDKTGFDTSELEYGPGLYVPYFISEENKEAEELEQLKEALEGMSFKGTVSLEMGRFMASPGGYYVTKVADKKVSRGVTYLITDGGIHQLNYYGQMMAMKTPEILSKRGGAEEKVCLCGSLCTVNDVLARDVVLDNPQKDDILVFVRTGAYSSTEGISHFLSRDLPAAALYRDGTFHIIRNKKELWRDNYGQID